MNYSIVAEMNAIRRDFRMLRKRDPSISYWPLDHNQSRFSTPLFSNGPASRPLLSESLSRRFLSTTISLSIFYPPPSTHSPASKKKKLFQIISSFNYFNFVQKFIHNIFKPISFCLHSIVSFFTLLARKRRRISLVFVIKKKKKKRGRRKRTGTLFAYEARSLWRIIVAQAGTYRHDDKEDRFPSAARKNYTRGNTSLVRITGRFPQTSEPDCEPVYFRLRKSRGRKMLSFFFLASSSSFFSFLYLFS